MKILACSDIHLGRIPAIPGMVPKIDEAWNAIVHKAIDLKVDVLVLAGDVVERDNSWFEAYGPLKRGFGMLEESGIAVVAIAGNHDATVFPSLADDCKAVRMLGLGGRWDHCDIGGVRFVGWSFPSRSCRENPLDTFDRSLCDGPETVLGLLHCDVDGPIGGTYASVPSSSFGNLPVPLWVLGHIHGSRPVADGRAFYCGSPFALDSAETGKHGAWLLETEGGNSWKKPSFVPLSPWLFCRCDVDLDGVTGEEGLRTRITDAMHSLSRSYGDCTDLYCQLHFTGTVPSSLDLARLLPPDSLSSLELPANATDPAVHPLDSFADETMPPVDLPELAKGNGPEALLARQLLDTDTFPDLVETVRQLETESCTTNAFNVLGANEQTDPGSLIHEAGIALLRAFANQKEEDR
jgi:hypothetical protein